MSQSYPGPPQPGQPQFPGQPPFPGPYGAPPSRRKLSGGAIVGVGCGGVFLVFVVIALIGALFSGGSTDRKTTGSTPSVSAVPSSSAPSVKPSAVPSHEAKPASTVLPDFVGMGLQFAQDKAQAAGFYRLTSHDALGRGRNQFLDRNWKVCTQTPQPGRHPADTKVDFGTVQLTESCPAKDQGGKVDAAGSAMPDFRGKSVKVARQALDSSTSLTVKDASGADRLVIVESNWKVCTQVPGARTALNGQPVSLTAVKFDESC